MRISLILISLVATTQATPIVTKWVTAETVTVWHTVTKTITRTSIHPFVTLYQAPPNANHPAAATPGPIQHEESDKPVTSSPPPPEPTTTSTTTTTITSSTTINPNDSAITSDVEFAQEILAEHNRLRALHNAPPLQWNNTLAKFGLEYGQRVLNCINLELVHSDGPYGENLAAGYMGGKEPVVAWYEEINNYDYNNPVIDATTGHFTQVVWKSTTQVGCARIMCDSKWRQYTICEYSEERGNVIGIHRETGKTYLEVNVLPLARQGFAT